MNNNPLLVSTNDAVVATPGQSIITLAEALIHLASSSLDRGAALSESEGGYEYLHKVGVSMGVLSHLVHNLILKPGAGSRFGQSSDAAKLTYEDGFKVGIQAAKNVETVFFDK